MIRAKVFPGARRTRRSSRLSGFATIRVDTRGSGAGEPTLVVTAEPDLGRPVAARLEVDVRELRGDGTFRGRSPVRRAGANGVFTLRFPAPRLHLWFPRGRGLPALHDVRVTLRAAGGRILRRWQWTTGFRTASLRRRGAAPWLLINGVPVFAGGAVLAREAVRGGTKDRCRLTDPVALAARLNIAILRVRADGSFPDEAFLSACDAAGLLLRVDVPPPGAASPREHGAGRASAVATRLLRRLRRHPSVAVLAAGGEESGDSRGLPASTMALRRLARVEFPEAPWLPRTPAADFPRPLAARVLLPSLPGPAARRRFRLPSCPSLTCAALASRCDDRQAYDRLLEVVGRDFRAPRDFREACFFTGAAQAEEAERIIEAARVREAFASAQDMRLMDAVPAVSQSLVDGTGEWKPAAFAVRRALRKRLLAFEPGLGGTALHFVNDGAALRNVRVTATLHEASGRCVLHRSAVLDLPARACRHVFALSPEAFGSRLPRASIARAEARLEDRGRILDVATCWLRTPALDVLRPEPVVRLRYLRSERGWTVLVTARTAIRGLWLRANRSGVCFEDNFIDLLPGETRWLRIDCAKDVLDDRRPRVEWCSIR